jgi:hypothetical protein
MEYFAGTLPVMISDIHKNSKSIAGGGKHAPLLVLSDPLTVRVFFYTGIISKLLSRNSNIKFMSSYEGFCLQDWPKNDGINACLDLHNDLVLYDYTLVERAQKFLDSQLDKQIGYFPVSIRFNIRHKFQTERLRKHHHNWFYDETRKGLLPDWDLFYFLMRKWVFSSARFVPQRLTQYLRKNVSHLIVTNLQFHANIPLIIAAYRLGIPIIAYIASWDHPVGKGIVFPHCCKYIVQNKKMANDLVNYQEIERERITVTGWPQSDVFAKIQPRNKYNALLDSFGINKDKKCVLITGNTETNAPYELQFLERFFTYWRDNKLSEKFSLIFRPHPKSANWQNIDDTLLSHPGFFVQRPSYTDIEDLSTLLHFVDCVVTNAGTILLDSIINDRPVVCMLYDEGAPEGVKFAAHNVTGEHYKELMSSGAFIIAESFRKVVSGIERCLDDPGEHRARRKEISDIVVGSVDGQAADRVAGAIIESVAVDG